MRVSAILTVAVILGMSSRLLWAPSFSPESVWIALSCPKGVQVAKVRIDGAEQFIFFPGTNWGPMSSALRDSPFRCKSLEEAQSVVRAKPDGVVVYVARVSDDFDDAQIMMKMTREERIALGLEEGAEQGG